MSLDFGGLCLVLVSLACCFILFSDFLLVIATSGLFILSLVIPSMGGSVSLSAMLMLCILIAKHIVDTKTMQTNAITWSVIGLIVAVLVSCVGNDINAYGQRKLLILVGYILPLVLCLSMRLSGFAKMRRFLALTWFTTMGYVTLSIAQLGEARQATDRYALHDLVTGGQLYGLALLLGVCALWNPGRTSRPFTVLMVITAATMLFISGTRAAFVSCVAACVVFLLLDFYSTRKRGRVGLAGIAILSALVVAPIVIRDSRGDSSVTRLAGGRLFDSAERQQRYLAAIAIAQEEPLMGHGPGGFKTEVLTAGWRLDWLWGLTISDDTPYYPHNVLLELLCEQGLVGVSVFVVCVFVCASRMRTLLSMKLNELDSWTIRVVCSVFVYGMVLAQLSLDLTWNNIMWIGIGLVAALGNANSQTQGNRYDAKKKKVVRCTADREWQHAARL